MLDSGWAVNPATGVLTREARGRHRHGMWPRGETQQSTSGEPRPSSLCMLLPIKQPLRCDPVPHTATHLSDSVWSYSQVLRGPDPTQRHGILPSLTWAMVGESREPERHLNPMGTPLHLTAGFHTAAQPPGKFCPLSSSENKLRNWRALHLSTVHGQRKWSLDGLQEACDPLLLRFWTLTYWDLSLTLRLLDCYLHGPLS